MHTHPVSLANLIPSPLSLPPPLIPPHRNLANMPPDEEMESEKEEDDSDGEEGGPGSHDVQADHSAVAESVPRLSKAQERELRRVRKTDYRWVSSIVDA